MNIRTINVPRGIEYISDIAEIKTEYNNDLPHNAVISKQLTGTGGTSIALTNDQPYIIAVHLVAMIKCKVDQTDRYPDVLGIYEGVTAEDIRAYVARGGKKILTTYDAIPKIKEALGSGTKDFRLLVDEFHKLISYLGNFKPRVAIKLLDSSDDFKSISYLTATPTDYRYLPKPMKELDIVELDWEGKSKPDLKHVYIKEGMVERVLSTILDIYDNTDEEIYVFYNSKVGVASILKKLFKCKKDLTFDDINLMFANNDSNTAYFKKHLSSKLRYGIAPDGINNKRLNFISSMGFEGIDFYPNQVTGANPTTLVVSDPDSKSMRYDINVDLVQILGRFRKNKLTERRVENKIVYFWNTQKSDYFLDEDEFLAKTLKAKEDSVQHLEAMKDNDMTRQLTVTALRTKDFDHLILDSNQPMLHPYGVEAQMSAYKTMHSDSSILNNIDVCEDTINEDSTVITKLSNLNPELSTYIVPVLPSDYTKALGRVPSVTKLVSEYENLIEDYDENKENDTLREECVKSIENFLISNPLFNEWLNAGITPAMMKTSRLNRTLISEKAIQTRTLMCNTSEIKAQMKLKIGEVYTRDELLKKVLRVYKDLGLPVDKAKPTDIKKWYKIKSHTVRTSSGVMSAYKIEEEL